MGVKATGLFEGKSKVFQFVYHHSLLIKIFSFHRNLKNQNKFPLLVHCYGVSSNSGIVHEYKFIPHSTGIVLGVGQVNCQISDKLSSRKIKETAFLSTLKESSYQYSKLPDECLPLLSMCLNSIVQWGHLH